jgi:hypothetical protein
MAERERYRALTGDVDRWASDASKWADERIQLRAMLAAHLDGISDEDLADELELIMSHAGSFVAKCALERWMLSAGEAGRAARSGSTGFG